MILSILAGCVLAGGAASAYCQAVPTAARSGPIEVFGAFGGIKTQVAAYTFNALGISGGVSYRFSRVFHADVRVGSYPYHARFSQTPITAGLAIASHSKERPQPFVFVGGGMSKSEDAGLHYVTIPSRWAPCWQVAQGLDIPVGRIKWRLYEAVLTEMDTRQRRLRSVSVSTGFSCRFGH
jgi:hypothetical protein